MTEDYRSGAKAARAAAQVKLRALREARCAQISPRTRRAAGPASPPAPGCSGIAEPDAAPVLPADPHGRDHAALVPDRQSQSDKTRMQEPAREGDSSAGTVRPPDPMERSSDPAAFAVPAGRPPTAMLVSPAATDLSRRVQRGDSLPAQSRGGISAPPPDMLTRGTEPGNDEDPAHDPVAPAGPTAAAEPATDLTGLPGIGPGLLALFAQGGVRSLADLAVIEIDPFRVRLGVAGQLLDLDAWVERARSGVAHPADE